MEESQGDQHPSCLKGTRIDVLQEIAIWAVKETGKPVFCLVDKAGTGKSTIVAHMARRWENDQSLISRFFFSNPKNITSGHGIPGTLAKAMANRIPLLRSYILAAIEDHSTMSEGSIEQKLGWLVFTPLKKLRDSRQGTLDLVRKEMQQKTDMKAPNLKTFHESIRVDENIKSFKKTYLEALNTVNTDGPEEGRLAALEVAYVSYLKAIEGALICVPIIVIDALDECNEDDRLIILESFLQFFASSSNSPPPFKMIFTSRPEKDIMPIIAEFHIGGQIQRNKLSLHSTAVPSNQQDIDLFTRSQLSSVLEDSEITKFILRAGGLFLWASTAAKRIATANNRSKLIKDLLESSLLQQPLDSLYDSILNDACDRIEVNERPDFFRILTVISKMREPLVVQAMDELLSLESPKEESISSNFLRNLSSVLSDGNDGKPIQALHPTFTDYLLRWLQGRQPLISLKDDDSILAEGCLAIMLSEKLKYDILNVLHQRQFVPPNREIETLETLIQGKTTPGLRYAAVHVLSHVVSCLHNKSVIGQLRQLYETKLLFWIELMSYLGKIYPLMESIHLLASHIRENMRSAAHILVSQSLFPWLEYNFLVDGGEFAMVQRDDQTNTAISSSC